MIKWLKRADLYEKVWTTPVIRLAPEFGISDVALHKICRRHKIPVQNSRLGRPSTRIANAPIT